MVTEKVAIVIPALIEEAARHRLLAEIPRTSHNGRSWSTTAVRMLQRL